MSISGAQLRMARVALRWPVKELAREAGVATATITRLEAGLPAHASTRQAIRETLERAGIVFVRRRDGEGILLTHATECVCDLMDIARGAGRHTNLDVAIRDRIDRFLLASGIWQKEWRLASRTHYVRELVERLQREVGHVESAGNDVLSLALRYIHTMNLLPAAHKEGSSRHLHITRR
jgi:transcriptional regulator with XRE-family HTH domain